MKTNYGPRKLQVPAQEALSAMPATSSTTAFAADDVDAATSQVTEDPPVVAGGIELPAECKLFISIPSCGCSPVPIVPIPSKRKELFQRN
jgi:hypothetical protein